MNQAVAEALEKLESGRWNAAKALRAIEKGREGRRRKGASWLRVKIVENGKKKFSFRLPLGAVSLLLGALGPIVKRGIRHAAKKGGSASLLDIEKLDLRKMLKILKSYSPMTVVEVHDGDTEVLIVTT